MITFSCIKRTWQKLGSFYVFEKMQDMANETGQQILFPFLLVTGRESNWLIENHMISAVIGVPDRLFLNTSIKKGEEHE